MVVGRGRSPWGDTQGGVKGQAQGGEGTSSSSGRSECGRNVPGRRRSASRWHRAGHPCRPHVVGGTHSRRVTPGGGGRILPGAEPGQAAAAAKAETRPLWGWRGPSLYTWGGGVLGHGRGRFGENERSPLRRVRAERTGDRGRNREGPRSHNALQVSPKESLAPESRLARFIRRPWPDPVPSLRGRKESPRWSLLGEDGFEGPCCAPPGMQALAEGTHARHGSRGPRQPRTAGPSCRSRPSAGHCRAGAQGSAREWTPCPACPLPDSQR